MMTAAADIAKLLTDEASFSATASISAGIIAAPSERRIIEIVLIMNLRLSVIISPYTLLLFQ